MSGSSRLGSSRLGSPRPNQRSNSCRLAPSRLSPPLPPYRNSKTVTAPGEKSEADCYFSSLSDARIVCYPVQTCRPPVALRTQTSQRRNCDFHLSVRLRCHRPGTQVSLDSSAPRRATVLVDSEPV